jgi:predicted RNA-binding Zn ribbon-like protein
VSYTSVVPRTLDLEAVRDFLNTLDLENGTDALASTSGCEAWLKDHDPTVGHATARDLELARRMRSALRSAVRGHHDDRPPERPPIAGLDEVAAKLPLRVTLDADGRPALASLTAGVRGYLARILAAVAGAGLGWSRLKICPADDCQWAFVDVSRNGSRRWCSMDVCGNRSKTRSYRRRLENMT